MNATAKSIALAALASVDQVELWRKHLLNEDPRVSIAALTYLTDRVAGKPSQVFRGDQENPIPITLEWTSVIRRFVVPCNKLQGFLHPEIR